jgi:protein-tyrosine phosphatase
MPFVKWTKSVLKEVVDIANRGRITLVLAHIERYLSMQDKNVVQMLLNNNVLIQVNSDFFTGFFTKSKALSMFKNNQIHFIGSDCHNMEDRAPDISKAMLTIEHKFGLGIVEEYIKYTNSIISKA